MRKEILIVSIAVLLYFSCCNSGTSMDIGDIQTDSSSIAKGEASFNQYCSSCHNFRQGSIGPQLGGLTDSVSTGWIRHFIKNPKKIIESGDTRAQQLFKKYKVAMPSFDAFTDDEINGIIAFIHSNKATGSTYSKNREKELSNPIPEPIRLSNLVVGLKLVTQIPASSDSGKLPLTRITKLDFEPGTGISFILDLRGKLYRLQNNKPEVYMDMARLKPKFINEPGLGTGFGSFAFHPGFRKKRAFIYRTFRSPRVRVKLILLMLIP